MYRLFASPKAKDRFAVAVASWACGRLALTGARPPPAAPARAPFSERPPSKYPDARERAAPQAQREGAKKPQEAQRSDQGAAAAAPKAPRSSAKGNLRAPLQSSHAAARAAPPRALAQLRAVARPGAAS